MTEPRDIEPGVTYRISRPCTLGQFLLRPGPETNKIFLYCLGVAAARTGIKVHSVVQMPDGWTGVVTDTRGHLPDFLQYFHRTAAVAMNCLLDNPENFWASGRTSVTKLTTAVRRARPHGRGDPDPTTAGFVESPADWPGIITTRLRQVLGASRPEVYFRPTVLMPSARLGGVYDAAAALGAGPGRGGARADAAGRCGGREGGAARARDRREFSWSSARARDEPFGAQWVARGAGGGAACCGAGSRRARAGDGADWGVSKGIPRGVHFSGVSGCGAWCFLGGPT